MELLVIYLCGLVLTFISSGTVIAFSKHMNEKSTAYFLSFLMVALMLSAVWFLSVPILVIQTITEGKK